MPWRGGHFVMKLLFAKHMDTAILRGSYRDTLWQKECAVNWWRPTLINPYSTFTIYISALCGKLCAITFLWHFVCTVFIVTMKMNNKSLSDKMKGRASSSPVHSHDMFVVTKRNRQSVAETKSTQSIRSMSSLWINNSLGNENTLSI